MSRTINLNSAELRARDATATKLYAATKATNLVPPRTHGNHAMKSLYTGNSMQSPRAEADNNLQHDSLKLGAQIEVRAV